MPLTGEVKRYGVAIGRKPRVVHRFVPLTDLRNPCGAARRVRAGPKMIRRKGCCQEKCDARRPRGHISCAQVSTAKACTATAEAELLAASGARP